MRVLLALIPLAFTALAVAEDASKTNEVKVESLILNVPSTWKQEKPSNNLRLAQFVIPAAEGDKEAGELYISPPIGGTAEANIERWVGQFVAEGREVKMTQGETAQGKYIVVDLKGTYNKPDGPPVLRKTKPFPGYRMYGVIFSAKEGGNYFFKLTGPEKTVTAQADALRASFGAKAADEKEYKLEQ
jgi:gluconolactonase